MQELYIQSENFNICDKFYTEKNFKSFYIYKNYLEKNLLEIFNWTIEKINFENDEIAKNKLIKQWNNYKKKYQNHKFIDNWKKPKYLEYNIYLEMHPRLILNFLYKYSWSIEELYVYLDLIDIDSKELLKNALNIFSVIHYYTDMNIKIQCLHNNTMNHICPIKSIKCPDLIHWNNLYNL